MILPQNPVSAPPTSWLQEELRKVDAEIATWHPLTRAAYRDALDRIVGKTP